MQYQGAVVTLQRFKNQTHVYVCGGGGLLWGNGLVVKRALVEGLALVPSIHMVVYHCLQLQLQRI